MKGRRLLVVVPDRVSEIAAKGEYVDRYYNPGNLFPEVHLLLTNDDRPDPAAVQRTVGDARLSLHNLPLPPAGRTLGRLPFMLGKWTAAGVALARRIGPDLLRVHGNSHQGLLAVRIRESLGTPLVVSLHTHPDDDVRGCTPWWRSPRARLASELTVPHEKRTLRGADWVLPVYESIAEYALRRGARRVKVCYNMLNAEHLGRKESYRSGRPPRIICVGRQFREKNPEHLVRAVAKLDARLTLVGDGPYHRRLRDLARRSGVAERVVFHRAVPNDRLCLMLRESDLFAAHCQYNGIPKAVIEPLLTGLPVVVNRRRGRPVAELEGDWVRLVENSPGGYRDALGSLLEDEGARERLGRRAADHAWERYAPERTEAVYAGLYREVMTAREGEGGGARPAAEGGKR